MIDTPFMAFWSALNETRPSHHMPELRYGEAKQLWEDAKDTARLMLQERMRKNDY